MCVTRYDESVHRRKLSVWHDLYLCGPGFSQSIPEKCSLLTFGALHWVSLMTIDLSTDTDQWDAGSL
jgi:hypothetical protein